VLGGILSVAVGLVLVIAMILMLFNRATVNGSVFLLTRAVEIVTVGTIVLAVLTG
jgi:hypothetical protein